MGLFGKKPSPEAVGKPEAQPAQAEPKAEKTMDAEALLNAKLARLEEVNTQRNALGRLEKEIGELTQITVGAPETVIAQKQKEIKDLTQRIKEGEAALQTLLPEATITFKDGQTVAIIDGKEYIGPRTSTEPIRVAGAEPEEGGVELASGDVPRKNIDTVIQEGDIDRVPVNKPVVRELPHNIDETIPTSNPRVPDTSKQPDENVYHGI